MKTFYCDACGALVFFENVTCLACGHALGFLPDVLDLSAMEHDADGKLRALAAPAKGRRYRVCANGSGHGVCNWMVPAESDRPFCVACQLNETIPDLPVPGNLERWHRLELSKRRLVYTLLHLGLPLAPAPGETGPPLRFRFLADTPDGKAMLTGHANGVITINVAEADDAVREQRRVNLHEPFRTLLGHFRHEVAHYYWDILIATPERREAFRALFGDEQADYKASLERHYKEGPPADWTTRHVSAYASSHPWEDWAETFAHYLHIVDAVETAASFGLSLRPRQHPSASSMTAEPLRASQPEASLDAILATWYPLTYALNSLNRGMGLNDLYPFVLPAPAVEKLRFIHDTLQTQKAARPSEHAA